MGKMNKKREVYMGYTTDFEGRFEVTPKLDKSTYEFLCKFSDTRRMKRKLPEEYGVDGEFYVLAEGVCGQDDDSSIVDYNVPPSTQPSLWCDWAPTRDRMGIEWNGAEKFYHYIEWIEYIIEKILEPRGYKLNGKVRWSGEELGDIGRIMIKDNKVTAEQIAW